MSETGEARPAVVTVFGGSQVHPGTALYDDAVELGRLLGRAGYAVCNGGYMGTMEAVSRGCKEVGGRTIGVTVEIFSDSRTPNKYLDEVVGTASLLMRLDKLTAPWNWHETFYIYAIALVTTFVYSVPALGRTKARGMWANWTIAVPRGCLLKVPDLYMEKLAIGPGYERGIVDLDAPAGENALRLAQAKGVKIDKITCCVLDRPRHEKIIADLRKVGARINLIPDGDVAGIINTTMPETGIDMYVGQGKAPEAVLAAAALRCVGGQMQARFAQERQFRRREPGRILDADATHLEHRLVQGWHQLERSLERDAPAQRLASLCRHGGQRQRNALRLAQRQQPVERRRRVGGIVVAPPHGGDASGRREAVQLLDQRREVARAHARPAAACAWATSAPIAWTDLRMPSRSTLSRPASSGPASARATASAMLCGVIVVSSTIWISPRRPSSSARSVCSRITSTDADERLPTRARHWRLRSSASGSSSRLCSTAVITAGPPG